ncbi:GntR family transcriptional regulator [Spongiactinospora gelatinilytica]|uniref:GntR family transcriptional regulator n=1 Tax=Spongiactinospora gelatinilytica TaxID=2666298 RepID=A0A2W2HS55_9ACTN|nr:GntR family transcriptional regulator [Spongiactinospora gelatinilytica]PZG54445.1 GntR family transcriptional regulator [Spongiactinospora gelatinilytica]
MSLPEFTPRESVRRRRLTARDVVAEELRRGIVSGRLPPGTKLTPQEVAERLGVSQTPAREAIQLLTSEGLIQNDAFRGAQVSPLTVEEYEELYLMRIGIEGFAARLGAERIAREGVEQMAELLTEMEHAARAADFDRFYEADHQFHRLHYRATNRESLVRRIMNLRVATERYARVAYRMPKVSMEDTLANHRSLLDAVRAGDGSTCEAVLKEDLSRTLDAFTKGFPLDDAQ